MKQHPAVNHWCPTRPPVNAGARLYYSTEQTNGEIGELKSVSFSGPKYDIAESYMGYQLAFQRGPGDLTFEVGYNENFTEIVALFDARQLVEWTIELPATKAMPAAQWGFKGYVSAIETALGFQSTATVKVQIAGPVVCYSDVVAPVPDNTPVLTKLAGRKQADNIARMLAQVLAPAAEPPVYVPNTADLPEPPQPEPEEFFEDWDE